MEVPLFRGAVIAAVGQESSVLLHNHEGNNYRYAYPLIQYKTAEWQGCHCMHTRRITGDGEAGC